MSYKCYELAPYSTNYTISGEINDFFINFTNYVKIPFGLHEFTANYFASNNLANFTNLSNYTNFYKFHEFSG